MAVEITGSGYNSKVKLYNIHQGEWVFSKGYQHDSFPS